MQPEARFKQALRRSFKQRYPTGLWTHIVKGPGMISGMPDLLVGADGRHTYLEAKIDTLLPRPTQRATFSKMVNCGMRVMVLAQMTASSGNSVLRAYLWSCPPDEALLRPHYSHPDFWPNMLGLR